MIDAVSIAISVLALVVSGTTAWLTLFRRGTVRMTQPTVIFFGPDAPRSGEDIPLPKIYLRTLLFATSKRGRIVESMHVSLARNEMRQNFNIWVHGDEKLVRGSGLFVGESGVVANHHFLTPKDSSPFQFSSGRYRLDVYARILGDRRSILLFSQDLEIGSDVAAKLQKPGTGLYFDWGQDSSRYLAHVEKRRPSPDPEHFWKHWVERWAQAHRNKHVSLRPIHLPRRPHNAASSSVGRTACQHHCTSHRGQGSHFAPVGLPPFDRMIRYDRRRAFGLQMPG